MAEKQKQGFTVSDRRLFTDEGELRPDAKEESSAPEPATPPASPEAAAPNASPPPTAEEQRESHAAYQTAHGKVDSALSDALGAQHRPEALQASFDSFIASLYMSAMLQLGLLHEQGEQPHVDIVGARHTIDTLAMLEEKTRGNLSESEKGLLQDTLFRLRMAFVEMTNALTRPPQNPPGK